MNNLKMIAILDYGIGNLKGVEFDFFTYTYKDSPKLSPLVREITWTSNLYGTYGRYGKINKKE